MPELLKKPESIIYLLGQGGVADLTAIFACLALITLLMALRQKMLLGMTGLRIRTVDSFKVIVLSTVGSYLTPFTSGSFFAKAVMLPFYTGATRAASILIASYEQAFEIIWVSSLLFFGMAFFSGPLRSGLWPVVPVTLTLAGIIIFRCVPFEKAVKRISGAFVILPPNIGIYLKNRGLTEERISAICRKTRETALRPRLLWRMMWPTALSFLLIGAVVSIISRLFGVDLKFFQALLVYIVPNTLGKLSGLPGGLGSQDMPMTALLVSYGANIVTAAEITMAFRAVTVSYIAALGGLILITDGRKYLSYSRKE